MKRTFRITRDHLRDHAVAMARHDAGEEFDERDHCLITVVILDQMKEASEVDISDEWAVGVCRVWTTDGKCWQCDLPKPVWDYMTGDWVPPRSFDLNFHQAN